MKKTLPIILFFLLTWAGGLHAAPVDPADALKITMEGGKGGVSVPIQILLLITGIALAPAILVMATSFVRIVTVLSFLRTGLSVQQPSNQVVISMALLLTAYIMAPVWQNIQREAIQPWRENKMTGEQAVNQGGEQLKNFMLRYVRERDLKLFVQMSQRPGQPLPAQVRDLPLPTVLSAFMLSELRTSFQMGLMVLLPFLVIDLLVSSVLMTLGMMMLPPTVVAFPLKIMVFVLVDGWTLIVRSLVISFN